ncbi:MULTISPECIES: TetR/AcrR family transcriptional regulator [Aquimarina]|uniref:TetR/AcrR family transcriptional regulator n=1 Tax=Aquimarina algiphila TaxID=2047982 RepID=A0A554VE76_9FLAO|nr:MULTISPECIES: TetR/AcrR family transcriptional regulator [Aquimarina]TSE05276.1 TetR/AcrR family transcriptional regulator [Aquimarina algiphila]
MNKKDQIVDAATKLFSERGFENTPISLVCEKANVSKGLIFHHFKTKNDLLREIFSKTTQLIVEISNSKQTHNTAQEKLLELIESFFTQLELDKMLIQLNLNIILQPNTRIILNDLIKERSSFILNSVKSIFRDIDSKNSLVMSYLFIAELDGIALNYLCIFDEYPLQQIKIHIINKYSK